MEKDALNRHTFSSVIAKFMGWVSLILCTFGLWSELPALLDPLATVQVNGVDTTSLGAKILDSGIYILLPAWFIALFLVLVPVSFLNRHAGRHVLVNKTIGK